jgi:hypothetical protein
MRAEYIKRRMQITRMKLISKPKRSDIQISAHRKQKASICGREEGGRVIGASHRYQNWHRKLPIIHRGPCASLLLSMSVMLHPCSIYHYIHPVVFTLV